MTIHPKYKRYFWQAFTFAVIWSVFGLVYVILERGILGTTNFYPATLNRYDFNSSLIYTPIGSFFMGFIQGWIEVVWMRNKFRNRSFWIKILFKSSIYLLMIIVFLAVLTLLINSLRYNASPWDPEVINSLIQFYGAFAFWSIVLYMAVIVDVALFFSEVRDYLGGNIFYNYSFGTYFKPQKENRIFMFLDMKSSTTIAEKMGHTQYFELIKSYYADMTDALLETSGEIYQYVGDEIVISWPQKEGLVDNNCLKCFQKINDSIQHAGDQYKSRFGFIPEFKAGLHVGEVTAGEIGTLKKEIIYTGDVLNTAARIQSLCNHYESKILISEPLKQQLDLTEKMALTEIGNITLRGKTHSMPLYKVDLDSMIQENT